MLIVSGRSIQKRPPQESPDQLAPQLAEQIVPGDELHRASAQPVFRHQLTFALKIISADHTTPNDSNHAITQTPIARVVLR